jgi:hypothetical protein
MVLRDLKSDWPSQLCCGIDVIMPLQSVEHWLEKADLARKSAETMSTDASKLAMLEIAELYEHLAERTRQLEQLGVTAKK